MAVGVRDEAVLRPESVESDASSAPDIEVLPDGPQHANRGVLVGVLAFLLLAIGTAVVGWQLFLKDDPVDTDQVLLQGIGTRSLGPFVRQPPGRSSPIGAARGTVEASSGLTVLSGSTPELYAVRAGGSVCDRDRLRQLLEIDPAVSGAWSAVAGLEPALIGDYVASLTPALLRHDVRVTDHDWSLNQIQRRQSVLEAGTAVLIDSTGVPVVRCVSGSPLLAPDATADEPISSFPGTWANFDPQTLVMVVAGETMDVVELFDVAGGQSVIRPIGSGGALDVIAGDAREETVIVPDPVGSSVERTESILRALGLGVTVVDVVDDAVAPGEVIRLVPPAGSRVGVNSAVVVEVSAGAERREVTVPDVVGQQIDQAIKVLEAAGLTLITETDNSRARASGEVISTSPRAFSRVSTADPIRVVVSRLEEVRVPDVKGLTLAAASAELVEFGLRPLILERYDPATPAGLVINTLPGTNTKLLATSSVTLAMSLGPPPRRESVPDVAGLTVEAGEAQLRALGFEIDYDEAENADVPQGLVAFSVPGKGTNYVVGSPVKLVISTGPPPVRLEVPDVTGLTVGEAGNRLRGLGLAVSTSESYSPDVPEGNVVLIIPGPGTRLVVGEQVVVYKSLGPEPGTATTTTSTTAATTTTTTVVPDEDAAPAADVQPEADAAAAEGDDGEPALEPAAAEDETPSE